MVTTDRVLRGRSFLPWMALLLVACGGGGGGGGGGPVGGASIAGLLVVSDVLPGPSGPILEAEPNDTPDTAHRLGDIAPGDTIVVHGHCNATTDEFDGYSLFAAERVRVTATLQFPDGGGNDFDFGVFDPVTFNFGDIFLATTAPEIGTFYAKGAFDLVVNAFAGSGDYVLTIAVSAPTPPLPEREPNGGAVTSMYLGQMRVGDQVLVAGSASSVSDASDGVSLTVPDGVRLTTSVSFPGGADFDIRIYDITSTFSNPPLLAAFESPNDNPESGFVDVAGGKMLWIEVLAFSGGGSWTLALQAGGPPLQAKPGADETPGPVASSAREAECWKHGRSDLAYGRLAHQLVPGDVLLSASSAPAPAASLRKFAPEAQSVVGEHGGTGCVRLALPAGLEAAEEARWTFARAAALRGRPGVRYAEPNYRCRAFARPNDTHYNLQWHYDLINLEAAWDVTTGSSDVIVAVIDTGITSHSDLTPRLIGGYDFITDPSTAGDGGGPDPDPTDVGTRGRPDGASTFHGSHVAGTIGAATNNGRGVAGVTWATRIMPLRVLGFGGGTIQDIATAVRYAARLPNATGALPPERADVINMSLGGGGFTQTMQDAVDAARAAGVLVVAAAGNDNSSAPSYPAAHAGVVSVSAVGPTTSLAPYSNYGSTIDVAAPGGDLSSDRDGDGYIDGVLSPVLDDNDAPPSEIYRFLQGTSMAAPHVAGVAALVLAVNPTLTPDQVESILKSTAQDLGAPGRDNLYGDGLIDAHAAVRAAQGAGAGAPALVLGTSAINFGSGLTVLDVTVLNGGGGQLQVTGTGTSTQDGAPWLSASLFGAGTATRTVDGVRAQVNRSGLSPGSYSGRVSVFSDGGTRDIQVLMSVSGGVGPPSALIYVLAIDTNTGLTVEQVVVDPALGLDYAISGLPAGTYMIAAGTDLDDDGFICDEGESCGVYPVASDPMVIGLASDEAKNGVDFVVAPVDDVAPTSTGGASGCGFRRLTPGP